MTELLQHLWSATLALTAAMLLVALLRVVWRRAFGAEHACHLWWLPPLAVFVSQLPHAAATPVLVHVPATLLKISTIPQMAAAHSATLPDWRSVLALSWSLGVLACLVWAVWRQWRFVRKLRGAKRLSRMGGVPPVWRAADTAIGPALVGAWQPRIVLPSDFEQRYEASERVLILAHETRHARRHDGLTCAFGTALQALFWFHPMVWWALPRMRRDQELACDAGVMRERSDQRREYALTMLKTQIGWQTLPAGCPWLNGHPIKERIAMLKLPPPHRARRLGGLLATALIVSGMTFSVYAAQEPAPTAVSTYQLSMVVTRGGDTLATPTVCLRLGNKALVSETATGGKSMFALNLHATSDKKGWIRVHVDGNVFAGNRKMPVKSIMRGPVGKAMSAIYPSGESNQTPIRLQLTPTLGCAAQAPANARSKGVSVRSAAQAIASAAGLVLENPKALSARHVAFHFDGVPSHQALQLVAKADGKHAVFHGKRVRFESP